MSLYERYIGSWLQPVINTVSYVQKKVTEQDFQQKINMVTAVSVEMYRVMVSSFLILFVPQKCGDHICSLNENLVSGNHLYTSGLVVNFATMGLFLMLYMVEVGRELKLIRYLHVNPAEPTDNVSVGEALIKLTPEKQNKLWSLDWIYQKLAYTSMVMFVSNTILSGFVVYEYYLDNQTTTTYITNILFMVTKLSDIYVTVNTDKNIFYSAYLRGKIQYNDVDPDELIRQNTPSPKKMEINKNENRNENENKLVEMNIHIHKINIDETNEKEMDKIVIHIENENNNNEEIV
jgi:hypothetical protein